MHVEKEAGGRKKTRYARATYQRNYTSTYVPQQGNQLLVILLDLGMVLHHVKQNGYQPRCVVANPVRGQLNRG